MWKNASSWSPILVFPNLYSSYNLRFPPSLSVIETEKIAIIVLTIKIDHY